MTDKPCWECGEPSAYENHYGVSFCEECINSNQKGMNLNDR